MSEYKDRNNKQFLKKGPILFIMTLAAFLATLNQSVMSVAVPELMHDFNIWLQPLSGSQQAIYWLMEF